MILSSPQLDQSPSAKLSRRRRTSSDLIMRHSRHPTHFPGGTQIDIKPAPFPRGKIDSTVDVLNDDNRFARSPNQELTENGIIRHHGGNEARLPRTRRTLKKITQFPRPPRRAVKLSALQKRVEIVLNVVLERGSESEGFESGRVFERNGAPSPTALDVAKQLPLLGPPLQIICESRDVVDVQ